MSAVPKTMKALQLMEFKQKYEIHEVPVPTLGDNDVLIKTAAAGFCHTDYQVWEGVYQSPLPIAGCHEPVGTIVAVGPAAQSKWKVGQRAGVLLFRHACHQCLNCKATNDVRFCTNADFAGLKANGGFAEYVIGDGANIVSIPDEIPFEQAAPLMCAGATVWSAIQEGKVPPCEPIGIIGIGGLGSLAVQIAKALGHPVVAIDIRQEGRDLATEFPLKADLVVNNDEPGSLDRIKDWAGKGGLPAVVVCTDRVPVIEWGLELLRPNGIYVPLGLPTDPLKFNSFTLIFKSLTIKGSLVATQKGAEDMLRAVAKHGIKSHITTVSFEEGVELPYMYMDPHLKGRLVLKY